MKGFVISIIVLTSTVSYAQQQSAVMETGKAIYTQRCMTCHQVDGSGAQNMIPPLIRTDYVLGDKAVIIKILLNGMTGEIDVNGDLYAGEMPSVKDLTDAEIAAVLTYVRNSFGNRTTAVTEEEVRKIRSVNTK